jgi:hypothetical protein
MRAFRLGNVAGLAWSAEPAAIIGTILLWALLSGLGVWLLDLPASQAIGGGLIATLLHWLSYAVHHLGHALAARQTGYPMVGVRLGKFLILGSSVYPRDEEALPGSIHIRRALGGPAASLLFTLVTGIIALALRPAGGVAWWVALFACLDTLVVFTLGALLPLGFTDGSTVLAWLRTR